MKEKVVVIGGSAAGMAAAARAKRKKPDLEVVVFERSKYVSYAPCGLPYLYEGLIDSFDRLIYYTADYFRRERGIDVRTRHEVVDIDHSSRQVIAINLNSGKEVIVEYDKLVLATGGISLKPRAEGLDLSGIYTIRTLDDGEKFLKALIKSNTVGIVGVGFGGLEMAEAITKMGKKVVLIGKSDHILPMFDKEFIEVINNVIVNKGISLRLGEKIVSFEGDGHVRKIVTDKGEYKVDSVLISIGIKPNTHFARKLGVKLGVTGAIKTNEYMQTSVKDIYSAGDNTETINLVTGKPAYIPSAPTANKMGRVAGDNIAGGSMKFPGVVGTVILKFFNEHIGKAGLSYNEALREGFNASYVDISHNTRSHYYPGTKKVRIRLVFDLDTHRVLGGQFMGYEGVIERVFALTAVITSKMTVEDLATLDLPYNPPFTPVWDPLIVAASVAMRKLS